MTRFSERDLLGRLPVTGPGEPPCLNRHPWTGYGCQAVKEHPPPCRYYSERGWHVEWYPDRDDATSRGAAMEAGQTPAELYLDLLKKCLTRYIFGEDHVPAIPPKGTFKHLASEPVRKWLAAKNMEIIRHVPFDEPTRREGRDWPARAESMIGLYRLDNLQRCVVDVLDRRVPGDLIEAGAWRGGATIFMRAVLAAYGDTERRVWVADSFQGLPRPDPERFPAEAGDKHWTWDQPAVSLEEVRANFERYGLLDDQVRFLPGWFRDSLPAAPIDRLAVLRLDGDMYGSTMDALEALYPKLSPGGYVIIDDYGNIPQCKEAVTDFRNGHGIIDPIESIDWTGVYWQRSADDP